MKLSYSVISSSFPSKRGVNYVAFYCLLTVCVHQEWKEIGNSVNEVIYTLKKIRIKNHFLREQIIKHTIYLLSVLVVGGDGKYGKCGASLLRGHEGYRRKIWSKAQVSNGDFLRAKELFFKLIRKTISYKILNYKLTMVLNCMLIFNL